MRAPLLPLAEESKTVPLIVSSNDENTLLSAAPSQTQERRPDPQEEKLITEQQQLAHEEKARRAREQLEIVRQLQIQQARSAAGLCTMCGRQRSIHDRLAGRLAHRLCKVFID
jgi:hypothetical protein